MKSRLPAADTTRPHIYRLKVTLKDVHPPLWRRLEIQADVGIDFVADAIRGVFGWSSCHGSEFKIKDRRYGDPSGWVRFDPEQEHALGYRAILKQQLPRKQERMALDKLNREIEALAERNETDEDLIPTLTELVPRVRTKFKFLFDFGDCWEHIVEVEQIAPADPGVCYPRCIGGAGADPLEDCGGAWRLTEMIRLVKTEPQHAFLRQLQHITPPAWNPDCFSLEETDRRLGKQFCRLKASAIRSQELHS